MTAAAVVDVVQGTDAWRQARTGMVTASRLSDVLAKVKSGEAAGRANYRSQLVAERLTGQPSDDLFENAAMRRGTEQEPFARAAYEVRTGVLVDQVGFVLHPGIEGAGCSPDGLVGSDGAVEVKCPFTTGHLETILKNGPPSKYLPQVQWILACTGRQWIDYISFDNRLPSDLALFVVRVPRDEAFIAEAEAAVRLFLAEVDEMVEKLRIRRLA